MTPPRPAGGDDVRGHLRDFPLAWRWTDPRWSVLPDRALRRIRAVAPEAARRDWPRALAASEALLRQAALYARGRNDSTPELHLGSFVRIDAKADAPTVRARLAEVGVCGGVAVTVAWGPEVAVTAAADVFCEFWNDFCYPTSDDVMVMPATDVWMLMYHHEEEFLFASAGV